MAKSPRPFNPRALARFAVRSLRPKLGPETLVYRYAILVPVEQIIANQPAKAIATEDDLQNLQLLLIRHFGGVTLSVSIPSMIGAGARDPSKPRKTLELNKHAHFTVYAAAVQASNEYFLALQHVIRCACPAGIARYGPLTCFSTVSIC